MIITRKFAQANKNTFTIKPIKEFVWRYWNAAEVSIDPFARNTQWATYRNDLNPNTKAEYHLYAKEFLQKMVDMKIKADLILFDPPYSLEQAKRSYQKYGHWQFRDTQEVGRWVEEKTLCNKLLETGGVFLHFGWHTNGLGLQYNCEIEEILIIAHGSAKNDTLCMAERKNGHASRKRAKLKQPMLF